MRLFKRSDSETGSSNTQEEPASKLQRLSAYDASRIIVRKKITDRTALLAFANAQKKEGNTDLASFIINKGTSAINDIITST